MDAPKKSAICNFKDFITSCMAHVAYGPRATGLEIQRVYTSTNWWNNMLANCTCPFHFSISKLHLHCIFVIQSQSILVKKKKVIIKASVKIE